MSERPDRAEVWRRLGPPDDQVGSVNEPRTRRDHGVRWNEKWVYRGEDGRAVDRVVLWHRYDLAGIFRIAPDGGAVAEVLPGS